MVEVVARGVSVWLGGRAVVREVDLELRSGATVGLVGPSGCGKSTLARALVGLEQATGSLRCDGVEVIGAQAWRGLRRVVHLCWQGSGLDPNLTVREIVDEARVLSGLRRYDENGLRTVLGRVALDVSMAGRLPAELSGGQRQRVALARALAAEPAILLADEITSAVDRPVAWGLVDLLRGLVRDGMGLLCITHDLSLLPGTVEQVVVMHEGVVVERGATPQVLSRPKHAVTRALRDAVPRLAE